MHTSHESTFPQGNNDACVSRDDLEAFLSGNQASPDWDRLSSHLQDCERCESLLDEVSEVSDFGVRMLSSLPPSVDDEPAYHELHAQLLSTAFTFSGDETIDELTDGDFGEDPFADSALPVDVDRYRLLISIGAGATGTVYKARHRELERDVAIKILSRRHSMDRDSVDRFRKEIRAIGQLEHPNIIRATDAGHVDGRHYLVMEYVDGSSLSEVVQQHGPLSIVDACEVIRQAALGLDYAHEQKMVHRDVKLSNLLLTHNGTVKLLDLGLVAVQSTLEADATNADQIEAPRGTADYMPPEQWTHFHQADHRSDLYSLGCTLFKLLTGTAPFFQLPAGFDSKRDAHLHHDVPDLSSLRSDVPAHLQETVSLLLAKQPERRIQSAAEVAKRVGRFARTSNLQSLLPNGLPTRVLPQPIYTRRKFLYGATAAVLLGGLANWQSRSEVDREFVVDTWHALSPARPLFLRHSPPQSGQSPNSLPATATTSESEKDQPRNNLPPSVDVYEYVDNKVTIAGRQDSLLHLGRPTRGVFSLTATFEQTPWYGGVGFFFGYQSTVQSTTFDTIRIVAEDQPAAAEPRVVWERHEFGWRDGQSFSNDVPLAEAIIPPSDGASNTITITLGRAGVPEVVFNKQRVGDADWILSTEGRQRSSLAADLRKSAFLGRLGVVSGRIRTTIENTRLKYHAN